MAWTVAQAMTSSTSSIHSQKLSSSRLRIWRLRSLARLYRQYAAPCTRPLPASLKSWYQPMSFHLQVGVCRFLEKKGMAQLGSFNVPVRHFPQRPQQLSLLGMPNTKIVMLHNSQGPTCISCFMLLNLLTCASEIWLYSIKHYQSMHTHNLCCSHTGHSGASLDTGNRHADSRQPEAQHRL